jgi:hypothetical protein
MTKQFSLKLPANYCRDVVPTSIRRVTGTTAKNCAADSGHNILLITS